MTHDPSPLTREIAAAAARLIVEEGMEYGPAKRRAARDLRQEVERSLPRAEVGQRQRGVGHHHAHQRHAGEVVALRHHLRADENVELPARE